MIYLLTRPVVWPYKSARLVGFRRLFVFGLGVAVGLLFAPTTGAAMRQRVRALVESLSGDMTNDPVPAESPVGREHVVDLTTQGV